MEDDDQPRVARAGRRAQAGRRSIPSQDDMGQEQPPADDLRASRSRGNMEELSSPGGPGGGPESPGAPPAPRRGQGFMDSGGGGGGGFMDGTAGGTSSFKGPAGGRGQPPADPLADDGGGRKFVGISRRKAEQATKVEEEKANRNRRYDDLATDGIMEIPELEEEGREDLSTVVAAAPKVRTNRVQGISELEEDMQFRLPTTDDRDIDLSVLTTVLCSSEQVDEGDEVWEPDILFTDVASELNREKEKAEGPSAEEGLDLGDGEGLLGQTGGPM